ncbi:hypothetical protein W911_00940 [Hyphomicrobium nitrativorans NL23]|uniref:Peptidase M50 n=1 Tax=Hyphomicrobium nitrativorans NL23 TaxID=1029756 RepID=V5SG20_9HYPH|nr:hypothetical protein [Hyphomicrobium nitrativorans]AHB49806.1 hypothetical protein W911_00940 [Hyphomicrobium nitrativorans NL23]
MSFLSDLFWSLYFLLRGLADVVLRRRRRRYVSATHIRAPREVVWNAVTASSITFDGLVPIEIATDPSPDSSNVYTANVRVGDADIPMAYREIERRPPEGLVIEMLKEGSDPSVVPGSDYFFACTLKEKDRGTELTSVHEITHETFMGRILVPLGARQNGRRLRAYCEAEVGAPPRSTNKYLAAFVTGALTYASFSYLFDGVFAAYLLLILLIHEAGHAIAMRWVGLPVQGIYFVPFMGGVAVAAAPHENESERGFVALMGPGLSLIPTALFLLAGALTGEHALNQLALVSAILNGFNLAPVLPLDGGHVMESALSGADPELVSIVNVLALIVGLGVALHFQLYGLMALLLLVSPLMINVGRKGRGMDPITPAGRNWLVAGYLATVAFYVAVVTHLLG